MMKSAEKQGRKSDESDSVAEALANLKLQQTRCPALVQRLNRPLPNKGSKLDQNLMQFIQRFAKAGLGFHCHIDGKQDVVFPSMDVKIEVPRSGSSVIEGVTFTLAKPLCSSPSQPEPRAVWILPRKVTLFGPGKPVEERVMFAIEIDIDETSPLHELEFAEEDVLMNEKALCKVWKYVTVPLG
jgi:hypothetical protein